MKSLLLGIFQREVAFQCQAIFMAAEGVDAAVARLDQDGLWFHIQNLVVAQANISKMLWGSRGKKAEQRLPLREALDVTDDSILRSPDLRNDFEHMDERLETWFIEGGRVYVGRNVGALSYIKATAAPHGEWFHHYDPTTGQVSFMGHAVDLVAAVGEAHRLLSLIKD